MSKSPMCKILFRAKDADTKKWVFGYYCHHEKRQICVMGDTLTDEDVVDYIIQDSFADWNMPKTLQCYEVIPETVCQYTGMTEFVMTDKSVNGKLFEGDIVEVWGYRRPKGYSPRSQYDGDFKLRAVIEFELGEWRLNYDNEYNHNLEKLQGKESDDRVVDGNYKLYRFGYHGSLEHEDWRREHNAHYKWDDIVKIGNIYDNPELLEGTK